MPAQPPLPSPDSTLGVLQNSINLITQSQTLSIAMVGPGCFPSLQSPFHKSAVCSWLKGSFVSACHVTPAYRVTHVHVSQGVLKMAGLCLG